MVTSAILGAAAGSGMALFVGLTIVIYRYYYQKRRSKLWANLDRVSLEEEGVLQKKPLKGLYPIPHKDFNPSFNMTREQQIIQPPQNPSGQSMTAELFKNPLEVCSNTTSIPNLQHQSKSYPGGQPQLCRTPSVSSQSSLDSGGHRGSSPQIRTFAPDGRTTSLHQEATHSSSYPLRNASRSPSPLRAASLDMRCSSPSASIVMEQFRTPSPSQSSLTSLTGGSASSTCNSPAPASPRTTGLGRCLSPLHIPSRGHTPDVTVPIPPASPLGAIQPDLYTRKDGPLFIGGSPKFGPSLGRLHFRLKYDFDRSDLVVHLIEAHDLASSDQGGFNDPYVRISMNPEVDSRKRQTTIHRDDPNPFFDQNFKFPVSHDDLQSRTLILQVFDYDRFSRNDIIGEVRMSMDEFDVTSTIEVWGEITKNKKPKEETQEVLLSLSYLPSAERLTVILMKARNLFMPKDKESIDPYVKVHLVVNGKRIKKKKTAPKKSNRDPVWNEAMTFSLSSTNLQNAAVEVCIFDQTNDLISNNPALLGCCVIGPKETGPERDHWIDMTQNRKSVACWHTLR
ncbi:synaptotagmin-5 isoform X2 [Onthophagus taurus]|uniref:synaptotagmin-5 isoform X2 n=1 Tax=Onthophagus taurus TaxID=166361 RepID=UPI000C1FFF5D|nr:synaptotagmin-5 isoform X2 [Onthophagus taurus]